jgi:brefeldin A-resistance guanine nucleotide exchange factor 1
VEARQAGISYLFAKMVPMIAARPSNKSPPPIPINETKTKPSHLGPSGVSSSGPDSDNPAAEEPFDKPPVPFTTMNGDGNKAHTMAGQQQQQPHAPMKGRKTKYVAPPQSSSKSAQVTSSLLIQPNNVCKVIKGEIHNVLNVMRTDPRYVSPLRFVEEIPTDEQHPLLLQLRELHHTLSEWELVHHESQPKAELYLTPFCDAIKGRDISATVTGAALHAIQKFLLYGFLAAEGPDAFKMIANTLLLCTFEESGAGASEGETRRRNTANQGANAQDDEQVVLKLLELSALVVRCASLELEPDIIVGLLDTCLHVSHRAKRASTLLKSAASDALGQIVLEVFSQSNLTEARVAILSKLASLLNPQKNSDAYVVNSLTLVNIALETLTDELTENEIVILQNDMCKFLLSWSTTHDLVILSLTMRVIFNLFQTIRNHLKVPLEVFLTSVHLRILEHSSSQEEREVALESLLEFCQEPALMKDLYLNYDCDVNCTNLYASICATLGKVSAPPSFSGGVSVEMDQSLVESKMNGVHHSSTHSSNNTIAQKAAAAAAEIPLNALNVLAFEGLLTTMESIARRVKGASKDPSLNRTFSSTHSSDSIDEELLAEQMSEEELQERKKQKAAFSKIAEAFNKNPNEKGWIRRGKDLGVPLATPEDVAAMLFKAPGLQKDKLGAYLGQGPMEVHPFEHKVRLAFVEHFDFTEEPNCASALRIFLHKFRMPGEAQCIDRFMEAFSQEFYKQQGAASVLKSSDAVFVLAFSTIMLNTDLHNASNKNPRMTCEQFIRNNRGINDGEDLPDDMLTELYNQISENELQVQTEIGEFISHSEAVHDVEHFRTAWEDLLSKNVAAASFTPTEEAWKTMNQVGVHEKDMFLVIAKPALKAISSAFVRSWDDGCILDALKGLEQMARISTYFGLDKILNDIMAFLLSQGREFIIGCISLEFHGIESGAPISQAPEDDETMSIVDPDSPIPQALMRAREMDGVDPKMIDISGAAAYRGLLALNMGLKIVRTLFPKVRSAWPQLLEVICSLRDARALPPGLADLDDFADSDGNVLPLSRSARASQKKLDEYYKSKAGREDTDRKGWFKMSLFGRKGKGPADGLERRSLSAKQNGQGRGQLTANQKTLLQVAKRVELDKIIVLTQMKLPLVKQCVKGMLEAVDKIPSTYSPTYEQHTAFALELATRALLANRERSMELLPFFLPKFEAVAAKVGRYENEQVMYPFLVERVIVTILRTSIHLFQVPQVCIESLPCVDSSTEEFSDMVFFLRSAPSSVRHCFFFRNFQRIRSLATSLIEWPVVWRSFSEVPFTSSKRRRTGSSLVTFLTSWRVTRLGVV